jgi:molybdenum cofactor cytidylyltransferase
MAMDRIAAVILAAGMSRRMGSPKALLRVGDTTVVARTTATALAAGALPVVVVTGHQPHLIRDALRQYPAATFAHNANFDAGGMLSSVQTGVAAIENTCDAFFLMLLDQPLVDAHTLRSMVAHRLHSGSRIVMPAFRGAHGHPLLIDAASIAEILTLGPDATLHTFVQRHRPAIEVLEVEDAGVVTDLDTPEDYAALRDGRVR